MDYLVAKSLHLVGIVCWFAGLFYIVRLMIYHREAVDKSENERNILIPQFKIMERRLWYGITWPSFWVSLISGLYMVYMSGVWQMPWFHIKAGFLLLLIGYHLYTGMVLKRMKENEYPLSSGRLRLYNEGATLLLVIIIFVVVLKSPVAIAWSGIGFVVFALLLLGGIKWYRKKRKDN